MDSLKIYFLGKEQPFWDDIKDRFTSEFPTRNFDFKRHFPEDHVHFQSALLDIQKFNPDVLFLDYSSDPKEMLTMARTIKRCLVEFNATIGLWDYATSQHLIDESNTTGVYINHIKSPELGEVIFQAITLATDSPLDKKMYATAEYNPPLQVEMKHQMKIGFITKDYFHIEHSIKFPPMGTPVNLQTDWSTIFDIKSYELLRRIDQNFYYHFPYCSDLKFHFNLNEEEPPHFLKKENEIKKWEEQQEKKNKLLIQQMKNTIDNWVINHIKSNTPKRTRLLIIDPTMEIIRQADKPLDEYPYSIRLYDRLFSSGNQIHRVRPGIIVIQLEDPKNYDELNILFATLDQEAGIRPFIIVFNVDQSTDELRALYNDKNLIAHKGKFNLDAVLKLCESYQKNQGRSKSHDKEMSFGDQENRFYPSKSTPLSSAYLDFKVKFLKLNEAFLSFESPFELTLYSVYTVSGPVPFAVTVMGEEKGYGENTFWGVIHCISETDRKKLRQYINKSMQQAKDEKKS